MNFQYYHNMESGVCVALDMFYEKGDIVEYKTICPEFGVARCSPKDQYSRKIGRSIACSDTTPKEFNLYSIIWEEDKTYYIYKSVDKSEAITLRTSEISERVYFVNYEVCE